jgi:hypothetical protein
MTAQAARADAIEIIAEREVILSSQRKAYDDCLKKLNNLFQLKISPMNADESLLSDEEYARRKSELMKDKARTQESLNDTDKRVEKWLEIGERTFNFACYAKNWFSNGTAQDKATILQSLGSNLILKDKKLAIELKKSLMAIIHVAERVPQIRGTFEPAKFGLDKGKLDALYSKSPVVCRAMDEVRTCLMWQTLDIYASPIPNFPSEKVS